MRGSVALGLVAMLTLVSTVIGGPSVLASSSVKDDGIDVAPNVLNIQSSGTVVTVHTAMPYSAVMGASVKLNDVEIAWWKADNQGFFVAKFVMDEVKALVDSGDLMVGELNTLTLTGLTTDGAEFEGSQDILVIDSVAAGAK